jgi:hypothetical protein
MPLGFLSDLRTLFFYFFKEITPSLLASGLLSGITTNKQLCPAAAMGATNGWSTGERSLK